MLIDWFTVAAQVVNFMVLVWLLRRFLYVPILQAIDAREADIASRIAEAEQQQVTAKQAHQAFEAQKAKLDEERNALMQAATQAANAERKKIMTEAQTAADALRAQQRQNLQEEARQAQQDLCLQTQQTVFAIARKLLHNLADSTLEEHMTRVFIQQLADLAPAAQAELTAAFETLNNAETINNSAGASAIIQSAFALPASQQSAITQALQTQFGLSQAPRFEIAPALVSGIALSAGSQKVAWNIDEYLEQLAVISLKPPSIPAPTSE